MCHRKGVVNTYDFEKRVPTFISWDALDERLIAVEATLIRGNASDTNGPGISSKRGGNTGVEGEGEGKDGLDAGKMNASLKQDVDADSDVEVYIFFVTSENGILLQDSFPRKPPYNDMLGIQVPYLHFRGPWNDKEDGATSGNVTDNKESTVYSKIMRDFVGLNVSDVAVRSAILEFSYNVALGKLDEAYKSVKAIESPAIWQNMAEMCVKTKRLDVAEVCLGNMGHTRGAAALRAAKALKENTLESCIGILAIQLGMIEDAVKCFRSCGRYDLLNQLLQASGRWEQAIAVAESRDRIHLKTTHYHYARHLESLGDVTNAIKHYEESGTFRSEVPRMLYSLRRASRT